MTMVSLSQLILFFTSLPFLSIVVSADLNDGYITNNLQQNSDYNKATILGIIPPLGNKQKGDAGKICIIGGSTEYTGAPYCSAISALKIGADLVYVITTEEASPIIKTYSPDLIVYPFLNKNKISKVISLLPKMDVIVIGPGLGREQHTLKLMYEIVEACKKLRKPLVIDADGLYALSKNITLIQNYPSPGVIITPNQREAKFLKQAILNNKTEWYDYWGEFVSTLIKGEEDRFHSSNDPIFSWTINGGGSGRRAAGQGDILSGSLGTFLNWALKSNLRKDNTSPKLAQSFATYAAANLTRLCNFKAFAQYGRSMTASDMISKIHQAFEDISQQ